MQITETSAEGLKHEFKVTVDADDIKTRIEKRLSELGTGSALPPMLGPSQPSSPGEPSAGWALRGTITIS